jgi:hypothetical protein
MMLRTFALATTALLLASGCTASVTGETDSAEGQASSAPPGSAAPAQPSAESSAAPAQPTLGPGFTLVSGDLGGTGFNNVSAVGGAGDVVAAATYVNDGEQMDAGMVISTDGGMTWQLRGPVSLPDDQALRGLMLVDQGVVLVGSTTRTLDDGFSRDALIMVAPAPDYELEVIPTPQEFSGDVNLLGVVPDGDDWVILGTTRKGKADSKLITSVVTVWRSPDEGATWSRTAVEVDGSSDNPVSGFLLGTDGSWNLYGTSYPEFGGGNGLKQFDASWLRSTDSGATFELMYPRGFSGSLDQNADTMAMSASGAVAFTGWDEVTESGETIAALWAGPAGEPVSRIGDPRVPVQGGTPDGNFLNGVLWDDETLVAWGPSDGLGVSDDVQFWAFDGSQLVPTTALPGNGSQIMVKQSLSNGTLVLLFGSVGDGEQQNVGVWAGSLAQE